MQEDDRCIPATGAFSYGLKNEKCLSKPTNLVTSCEVFHLKLDNFNSTI